MTEFDHFISGMIVISGAVALLALFMIFK